MNRLAAAACLGLLCSAALAADDIDLVVVMDAAQPNDAYYASAAAHYAARDLVVVRGVGDFQALAAALRARAASLGRALREVRVVVHGSEWTGFAVPAVPGAQPAALDAIDFTLRPPPFPPLSDDVLDMDSLIVVEACGLGRRPRLLSWFSRLLGGEDAARPRVISSTGFVAFETGGSRRRVELDYRANVAPGPAPADNGAELRVYPVRVIVIPPDATEYARLGLRRWLRSQPSLTERLATMGLTQEQLRWREDRGVVVGEAHVRVTSDGGPGLR